MDVTGGATGCAHWQEAISALADGEDPGVDPRLIDAHLAHCAPCRQWHDSVAALHRPFRVQAAPDMADLSGPVVRQARRLDRAGRSTVTRGLLLVVAAQITVLALPSLLTDGSGSAGHDARHLGAFSVAYAVGLVVVAIRPARTRTMLPVAVVLAGTLMLTAAVDVSAGRVPFDGEVVGHLPEVMSVVLVWRLGATRPRRTSDAGFVRRLAGRLREVPSPLAARRDTTG